MSTTKNPVNGRSPMMGRALCAVGGVLLVATGSVHLDLYLTGYRHIPTIGPLFLLQKDSAFSGDSG